ncbi:MAG: hypothetical protein NXI16_12805 [Alphaproteobacteria bacterium]|nr:hypothetical protein [Alphaproteobacteria bacterium]
MAKRLTIAGILLVYCGFFAAIVWNFVISSTVLEVEDLQFIFETLTGIGLTGDQARDLIREALVVDFEALKAGIIIGSVILPLTLMLGLYAAAVVRRLDSVRVPAPKNSFFVYNVRKPLRVTTADPTTGLPMVYAVRIELLTRSRGELLALSSNQDALRLAFTEELERLNAQAVVQVPQVQMEGALLEAGQEVVSEALARVRIKQSWFERKEEAQTAEILSEAA